MQKLDLRTVHQMYILCGCMCVSESKQRGKQEKVRGYSYQKEMLISTGGAQIFPNSKGRKRITFLIFHLGLVWV